MIQIELESRGATILLQRFAATKRALRDLRPLWRTLEPSVRENFKQWFASEGEGSWPRLSDQYARYKARVAPGQPMMVRTGRLRASLIEEGAPGGVVRLTQETATYGTSVWYARIHQRRLVPRRKVVVLSNKGRVAIRNKTRVWLKEVLKGAK